MADGIAVEQAGLPAVTVVGESFARAAELKKRTLGLPDFELVVVPVPRSRPAAFAEAERAVARVVARLTGAADGQTG